MSEEIIQKKYQKKGEPFGLYEFYNLGKSNISSLKKYKIIQNKDYKTYENKSPDALISDRRNKKKIEVKVVIEHKRPQDFNTEKKRKKAFEQCNNYCEMLNSKLGIITDGSQFFWINSSSKYLDSEYKYIDEHTNSNRGFNFIKNENGTLFSHRFESSNTESIDYINLLLKTINPQNSIIRPASTVSPSTLAKQVWQSVWLATGDDPKKCLMTFTELFIFKYLSDLKVLTLDENGNEISFQNVIDKGKLHCLKYYLMVVRPHIKKLFPDQGDGTTIINGLSLKKDQNQDGLFYDILLAFSNYGKLENIDPNFKSRLFEDFLKGTTGKKQLAQFFTPRNVIKAMVEFANVKNLPVGSKICDPACGVGGFLIESILNRRSNEKYDFYFDSDKLLSKIEYYGFDYDDLTIILAKANLLISLTELLSENPTLTLQFSELLGHIFSLENKSIIGSLARIENEKFNLIMSNPPYVSKGMALYRKHIKNNGDLSEYYSAPSIGKEGLFIQKMIQDLTPNGEAFIILPDGFFYRPADNELKKKILSSCFIKCIISLPEKTFYATDKKTYIIGLQKKEKHNQKQKLPVFAAIVKDIGESLDTDRIEISENDLITFTREYKYFSVDTDNYCCIDKKIKLIDIESFISNLNWIIENYWSNDEKIELGLADYQKDITDEDLFDNIEYFKGSLEEIKEKIEQKFNENTVTTKNFKAIKLTDKEYFKMNSNMLGLTRKQYAKLDTKNIQDIPLYTASRQPVAFIKELSQKPYSASKSKQHISFASDGDGTAGTNIFIHTQKYYLNTSRISFEILDESIMPEYIFCFLQDMKKKYGFDFRHKANHTNVSEVNILIPIDENGDFSRKGQEDYIKHFREIEKLKNNMIDKFFERINDFEKDINFQLSYKLKEYFNFDS